MYDADGRLVSSGSGAADEGWDGWFTVPVPIDGRPYSLQTYWFDSWWSEEPEWSYSSALIDTPGKTVTWWY